MAGLTATGEQIVILPGTHSKWVHVKGNIVVYFSTYMTGDIYNALLQETILKAAVNSNWTQARFMQGLKAAEAYHKEQKSLLSTLFQTRAQEILSLAPGGEGKGFLSGLLIGTEICDALSLGYESNNTYCLIGDNRLVELYRQAMDYYGKSSMIPKGNLAVKGLYMIAKAKNLI